MVKYYVYVLKSISTGRFYIGQTQDLKDRVRRHQSGYVRSTKGRGPWELYSSVELPTRSSAVQLERKLKRLKSQERVIKLLISLK